MQLQIQYMTSDLDLGVNVEHDAAQYHLHHMTYVPAKFETDIVQRFRRYINKKIHNLTFDLGSKVTQEVAQYPLHHMTYAPAKFEVAMSYLGVKVTQSVAQYPLQHVTYAPAKFEVATSNGLGGDA